MYIYTYIYIYIYIHISWMFHVVFKWVSSGVFLREFACRWYFPKDCHFSSGLPVAFSNGLSVAFSNICSRLRLLVCNLWP